MSFDHSQHRDSSSDDSYFVSMTDLMVGVLFVFILMLVYLALQIRDTIETMPLEDYKMVIQERDTALADRDTALAERDTALAEADDLREQLKELDRLERKMENLLLMLGNERKQSVEENEELKDARSRIRDLKDIIAKFDEYIIYLDNLELTKRYILRKIATLLPDPDQIEVDEQSGVLRLSADLFFDKGKATPSLSVRTQTILDALASALIEVLPCFARGEFSESRRSEDCNPHNALVEAVQLEGHADVDPVLSELEPGINSNLRLSARRATNTFDALLLRKPELIQLTNSRGQPILSVAAYGDTRPVDQTEPTGPRNRRIDLRIIMHVPRPAQVEEIKRLIPPAVKEQL